MSKGVFNIFLNLSKKGIVQRNVLEKKLFGEKKVFCSKWSNLSRKVNKIFEFLLSNALPGWLVSDERWINPTIFLYFFKTLPYLLIDLIVTHHQGSRCNLLSPERPLMLPLIVQYPCCPRSVVDFLFFLHQHYKIAHMSSFRPLRQEELCFSPQ